MKNNENKTWLLTTAIAQLSGISAGSLLAYYLVGLPQIVGTIAIPATILTWSLWPLLLLLQNHREKRSYLMTPNYVLCRRVCKGSCTIDFHNTCYYHGLMKPDLRISVKDFRRDKNLKILVQRAVFSHRQFYVRMNGSPWPKDGRPVSLTRLMTALRKSLVKVV
jgi:hypothetical protein